MGDQAQIDPQAAAMLEFFYALGGDAVSVNIFIVGELLAGAAILGDHCPTEQQERARALDSWIHHGGAPLRLVLRPVDKVASPLGALVARLGLPVLAALHSELGVELALAYPPACGEARLKQADELFGQLTRDCDSVARVALTETDQLVLRRAVRGALAPADRPAAKALSRSLARLPYAPAELHVRDRFPVVELTAAELELMRRVLSGSEGASDRRALDSLAVRLGVVPLGPAELVAMWSESLTTN